MPLDLPPGLLDSVGTVGLVVVVGWLVVTGRLVTAREHQQSVADRDAWHAAFEDERAKVALRDKQLEEMAEVGRTVNAIMQAIGTGPVRREHAGGEQ